MNSWKKMFALASILTIYAVGFSPSARADEWNKKTVITINEPILVPNRMLNPGTYVLKLLNSPSDRHIVQIFNENETHIITTILAIPNYRLQPTGKSAFMFWETPAGEPRALRAWFYPGDNFGQEFAYPRLMYEQLAARRKKQTQTETQTAEVSEANRAVESAPQPETTPTPTASAEPTPQPQAEATPAPAPEPEPASAPAELPHTASYYPLIGLAGLASLAVYIAMSARARRNA